MVSIHVSLRWVVLCRLQQDYPQGLIEIDRKARFVGDFSSAHPYILISDPANSRLQSTMQIRKSRIEITLRCLYQHPENELVVVASELVKTINEPSWSFPSQSVEV